MGRGGEGRRKRGKTMMVVVVEPPSAAHRESRREPERENGDTREEEKLTGDRRSKKFECQNLRKRTKGERLVSLKLVLCVLWTRYEGGIYMGGAPEEMETPLMEF